MTSLNKDRKLSNQISQNLNSEYYLYIELERINDLSGNDAPHISFELFSFYHVHAINDDLDNFGKWNRQTMALLYHTGD